MATTTRTNLRRALSEAIGDYNAFTTTADGNDSRTSLVSDTLRNYPGGADDGAFEEMYFLSTDGANSGESRRCSVYISSAVDGPTAILQSALSSQTASGEAFELHRYDPEIKHAAINSSLEELFPSLHLPLRDESIIVDNVLSNHDFENWTSGSADNWTEVNGPSTDQESSRIFHGSYGMKLTGPSGAVGQITQTVDVNITEIAGKTATFKCRVWTNGASQARLRIDWDGSNISNGDYHGGASEWELLSVESAVPSDATQVKVICEVAAEAVAYFDLSWLAIEPGYKVTVPSSFIRGPSRVLQQYDQHEINGIYYPLLPGEAPKTGRILQLHGMGLLSRPSTEAGTTEIGPPHLTLSTAYAAMVLFRTLLMRSASENVTNLQRNEVFWQGEVSRLSRQFHTRLQGASRARNIWHVEEDSAGRYLQFDVVRAGVASTSS